MKILIPDFILFFAKIPTNFVDFLLENNSFRNFSFAMRRIEKIIFQGVAQSKYKIFEQFDRSGGTGNTISENNASIGRGRRKHRIRS